MPQAHNLADEKKIPYGQEAIPVLLTYLEDWARCTDDGKRTVVVLAGYEAEMQTLWEKDSGLKSRFRNSCLPGFPVFPN